MRGASGFSLVDALVATLLTTLIMGSLLTVLVQSEGTFDVQQDQMEMRQEARVALDNLVGELRLAGFDMGNLTEPVVAAGENTISFVADLDNGDAGPPCDAISAASPAASPAKDSSQAAAGVAARPRWAERFSSLG